MVRQCTRLPVERLKCITASYYRGTNRRLITYIMQILEMTAWDKVDSIYSALYVTEISGFGVVIFFQ